MTDIDHTPPAPTHTPGPWDCDGCTTMYVTPHESDAIAMIEVRANVTEDGWNTVAFIEAIWPRARADARRIVAAINACNGIGTEALEQGVIEELLEALYSIDNHARELWQQDEKYRMGIARILDLTEAAIAKATGRPV